MLEMLEMGRLARRRVGRTPLETSNAVALVELWSVHTRPDATPLKLSRPLD